ncbi:MAG: hypothetical protein ACQGVC_11480 [Myxococcota bacterium]
MHKIAVLLLTVSLFSVPAFAEEEVVEEQERNKHPILFYLPNRVFDVMDLVRARVRIGPGIGVSARVTKPVSVTAGFYASLFAGLPGPRGEASIPWPVGVENYAGADVSVFGFSTESFGPEYGMGEVGAGVQAALVGVDVGVDPIEVLDLLLGFVFIDLADDDF